MIFCIVVALGNVADETTKLTIQRVEEAFAGGFIGFSMRLTRSTLPTHIEHRASTPTSAAPTCVKALERRCPAPFDIKRVVDEDLYALFNLACRPDEDPVALLFGFTIGRAIVIDPTRGVAALCAIDQASVVEHVEEGMSVSPLRPPLPSLSTTCRTHLRHFALHRVHFNIGRPPSSLRLSELKQPGGTSRPFDGA